MNRLTSGMAALLAVALVGACSGDPTGDLRNGVSLLTASPSTLNVTLGKNKTTQITAVDDQGNDITSAFEVTDIGPGIEVKRDSTYLPIYLSDSTLSVPPEAPTFQYVVTATGLASSHFTVAVGDKSVTVPVLVAPDPNNIPISTLVASGPNASDPVTITAPATSSARRRRSCSMPATPSPPACPTTAPSSPCWRRRAPPARAP
jgi:hypothetical protein